MELYTEDDFKAMLKLDEDVYANILQIDKQIKAHHDSWTAGQPITDEDFQIIQRAEAISESLKSSYLARQEEYASNKTYQFAKTTTKWVNDFTYDMMRFIGMGFGQSGNWLGAVQVAVPVAWVVGTTLVVGAVTYFCTKYFNQTQIDLNQGLETVSELAKVNPELAEKMLKGLMLAKREETKAQNSTAKHIVSFLAILGVSYLAYNHRDKIVSTVKSFIP